MNRTLIAAAATFSLSFSLSWSGAGARASGWMHAQGPARGPSRDPVLAPVVEDQRRPVSRPPGDTIHLVTFNIHAGTDQSGAPNLERVGELLTRLGADVVLLQEVDRRTVRSDGVDQLAELARLSGFYPVWGPSLEFQGGEYGIAILSRWPVGEHRVIPLPVSPPQERAGGSFRPRSALQASIETPHGTIVVLNTHLDPTPDDHHRRQEMDLLLDMADSLRSAGQKVVFGGDLNALPESAVAGSARTRGWTDSWQSCGDGDGTTYPAGAPVRRIDYLFIGPGVTCTRARVLQTQVSDHRPLSVILSIPGPGQPSQHPEYQPSTEEAL